MLYKRIVQVAWNTPPNTFKSFTLSEMLINQFWDNLRVTWLYLNNNNKKKKQFNYNIFLKK